MRRDAVRWFRLDRRRMEPDARRLEPYGQSCCRNAEQEVRRCLQDAAVEDGRPERDRRVDDVV